MVTQGLKSKNKQNKDHCQVKLSLNSLILLSHYYYAKSTETTHFKQNVTAMVAKPGVLDSTPGTGQAVLYANKQTRWHIWLYGAIWQRTE